MILYDNIKIKIRHLQLKNPVEILTCLWKHRAHVNAPIYLTDAYCLSSFENQNRKMDKLHILTIVLVSCGIAFMTVSLGTGIKSLLDGNWIYYAYSTTVSTTYLGNPATVVAVATANIGLYTTCYNIDTTTTVTTFLGTSTTSLNTNACVDSDSTGYISAGLFTLEAYKSSSYRKMICLNMVKNNFMHHA